MAPPKKGNKKDVGGQAPSRPPTPPPPAPSASARAAASSEGSKKKKATPPARLPTSRRTSGQANRRVSAESGAAAGQAESGGEQEGPQAEVSSNQERVETRSPQQPTSPREVMLPLPRAPRASPLGSASPPRAAAGESHSAPTTPRASYAEVASHRRPLPAAPLAPLAAGPAAAVLIPAKVEVRVSSSSRRAAQRAAEAATAGASPEPSPVAQQPSALFAEGELAEQVSPLSEGRASAQTPPLTPEPEQAPESLSPPRLPLRRLTSGRHAGQPAATARPSQASSAARPSQASSAARPSQASSSARPPQVSASGGGSSGPPAAGRARSPIADWELSRARVGESSTSRPASREVSPARSSAGAADESPPTESELAQHFAQHPQQYAMGMSGMEVWLRLSEGQKSEIGKVVNRRRGKAGSDPQIINKLAFQQAANAAGMPPSSWTVRTVGHNQLAPEEVALLSPPAQRRYHQLTTEQQALRDAQSAYQSRLQLEIARQRDLFQQTTTAADAYRVLFVGTAQYELSRPMHDNVKDPRTYPAAELEQYLIDQARNQAWARRERSTIEQLVSRTSTQLRSTVGSQRAVLAAASLKAMDEVLKQDRRLHSKPRAIPTSSEDILAAEMAKDPHMSGRARTYYAGQLRRLLALYPPDTHLPAVLGYMYNTRMSHTLAERPRSGRSHSVRISQSAAGDAADARADALESAARSGDPAENEYDRNDGFYAGSDDEDQHEERKQADRYHAAGVFAECLIAQRLRARRIQYLTTQLQATAVAHRTEPQFLSRSDEHVSLREAESEFLRAYPQTARPSDSAAVTSRLALLESEIERDPTATREVIIHRVAELFEDDRSTALERYATYYGPAHEAVASRAQRYENRMENLRHTAQRAERASPVQGREYDHFPPLSSHGAAASAEVPSAYRLPVNPPPGAASAAASLPVGPITAQSGRIIC